MGYPISQAGLLAAIFFAIPPAVSAAENSQLANSESLPSLELLEFLGSFETDSGEWVNPGELLQPDFEQLLSRVENAGESASGIDRESDNSISDETEDGNEN